MSILDLTGCQRFLMDAGYSREEAERLIARNAAENARTDRVIQLIENFWRSAPPLEHSKPRRKRLS